MKTCPKCGGRLHQEGCRGLVCELCGFVTRFAKGLKDFVYGKNNERKL